MRPLNLHIEGFTCYRDKQPVLDLSGMSLFAIAGPTGAGKSTILDAMLYALYGMVPRIGKHGVGEFVSHGRNVLSVTLDFALQGHTYRLMRKANKSSKGHLASWAALAELTPAGERAICDSVTDVNQQVEALLGLGFEAFTQTVILPQGEFARFLQSPAKERREILQHLLRHELYEEMRRIAEHRKGVLAQDLAGKDDRLQRLEGATRAALDLLQRELEAAVAHAARTEDEAKRVAESLADLKARRELTIQLDACRALAARHCEQAQQMGAKEEELRAAREASAVYPRVEALHGASKRLEACNEDSASAATELEQTEREHAMAEKEAEAAWANANDLPALRDRLQQLAEVAGDVNRRPLAGRELESARRKRDQHDGALRDARGVLARATEVASAARQRLESAQKALASLSFDPASLRALDALREHAATAEELMTRAAALELKIGAGRQSVDDKSVGAEKTRKARLAALADLENAREALRAADEARLEGIQCHSAAHLREHVRAGEPCPVCDRVLTEPPRRRAVPELAALNHARDQAETAAAKATDKVRNAERAQVKADGALENARGQIAADERELEGVWLERNGHIRQMADALEEMGAVTDADVLGTFRDALARLQASAQGAENARKEIEAAQRDQHHTAMALQAAQAAVAQAEQSVTACDQDIRRLQEELRQIQERIVAVTSAPDPMAERRDIAARIERIEADDRVARSKLHGSAEHLAGARARLEATRRALDEAQQGVRQGQEQLDEALGAHGFPSIEAVVAARRSAAEMTLLERAVSEFRTARAANQTRMVELESKVAGREVQQDAITEAVNRHEAAVTNARKALEQRADLTHRVQTLSERVNEAETLTEARAKVAARLAVTAEMAGDLRNDGFQNYLLEEAFKSLVTGASDRLYTISRRYTMDCNSKGEFYVLDHDNAAERRRAETLSGGETFMASLCLALQLSDEVLRASGAIRIDSLFIDEGFGTLDADSLSEVTDALEALREDGDRIVGVISHRPELTDRLPGCIRVEKGVGESRWMVERVG